MGWLKWVEIGSLWFEFWWTDGGWAERILILGVKLGLDKLK